MESTESLGSNIYHIHCEICSVDVSGERNYKQHLKGKKHRFKLQELTKEGDQTTPQTSKTSINIVPKGISSLKMDEVPELAPGEPVPPGFEDVVKSVSQIQAELDAHKSTPLIGLEYLVEAAVDDDATKLEYFCLLCDKKGAKRIVISHLTSFNHQMKYLKLYFPSVHSYLEKVSNDPESKKVLSKIMTGISSKIEQKFGRLKPLAVEKQSFVGKKSYYFEKISSEAHFRETPEINLKEVVDISLPRGKKDEDKQAETHALECEPSLEVVQEISLFHKSKVNVDKTKLRSNNKSSEESSDNKSLSGKESLRCDLRPKRIHEMEEGNTDSCFIFRGKRNKNATIEAINTRNERNNDHHLTIYKGREQSSSSKLSSISSVSSRSRSWSRSLSKSPNFYSKRVRTIQRRSRSRSNSRKSFTRSPNRRFRNVRDRYHPRISERSWSRSQSRSRSRSLSRSLSPSRSHTRIRSRSTSGSRMTLKSRYRSRSPTLKSSLDYRSHGSRGGDRSVQFPNRLQHNRELEKTTWEIFRAEADAIEAEMAVSRRRYERSPEKHPAYATEWKQFYSRRIEEVRGTKVVDPRSHEFKLEWIAYWGGRMNEMHDRELREKKDAIKKRLGLPEDRPQRYHVGRKRRVHHGNSYNYDSNECAPPLHEKLDDIHSPQKTPKLPSSEKPVTVSDVKSTWKALTGSEMDNTLEYKQQKEKDVVEDTLWNSRAGKGQEKRNSPGLIATLRLVTALEEQLGSLGPRVNSLLSHALALQRRGNSADSLLSFSDNMVLFETVKEKLLGQLQAGIVRRTMVAAVEDTIHTITSLLKNCSPPQGIILSNNVKDVSGCETITFTTTSSRNTEGTGGAESATRVPVSVPGIGEVDKVAIAQQIALALIEQGRIDVTEQELQNLVDEVIGMARAQAEGEVDEGGSNLVSSLAGSDAVLAQNQGANVNSPLNILMSMVCARMNTSNQVPRNASSNESQGPVYSLIKVDLEEDVCQKSYRTLSMKTMLSLKDKENSTDGPDYSVTLQRDLNSGDIKSLLQRFSSLSSEEKQCVVHYIEDHKVELPEEVEILRDLVFNERIQVRTDLTEEDQVKKTCSISVSNLSPFSCRQVSSNPLMEDLDTSKRTRKENNLNEKGNWESDSDSNSNVLGSLQKCNPIRDNGIGEHMISNREVSTPSPNSSGITARHHSSIDINTTGIIDDLMDSLNVKRGEKHEGFPQNAGTLQAPSIDENNFYFNRCSRTADPRCNETYNQVTKYRPSFKPQATPMQQPIYRKPLRSDHIQNYTNSDTSYQSGYFSQQLTPNQFQVNNSNIPGGGYNHDLSGGNLSNVNKYYDNPLSSYANQQSVNSYQQNMESGNPGAGMNYMQNNYYYYQSGYRGSSS